MQFLGAWLRPRYFKSHKSRVHGGALEAEVDVIQPLGAPQELHCRVADDNDAL